METYVIEVTSSNITSEITSQTIRRPLWPFSDIVGALCLHSFQLTTHATNSFLQYKQYAYNIIKTRWKTHIMARRHYWFERVTGFPLIMVPVNNLVLKTGIDGIL